MKKMTWFATGIAAFALSTGVALAGQEAAATEKKVKELEQAIEDQGIYVETSQKGIVLSGYVDTSYTYNFNGGGTTEGHGNVMGAANGGMGGDSQDFNVNAVKLALEKALPEENKLAAGFRVDLLMGEDWGGAGVNTITLQQAYVTFRAPVGNGLDVKVGQMVALLGLEVDERPANMNFSYGQIYTFGLPAGSEAGVNFKYKFNDNVTAQLRLANTDGVDSDFYDQADFSKAVSALVSITNNAGNAALNVGFWYTPDGSNLVGANLPTAVASRYETHEMAAPGAFDAIGEGTALGQIGEKNAEYVMVGGQADRQTSDTVAVNGRNHYRNDDEVLGIRKDGRIYDASTGALLGVDGNGLEWRELTYGETGTFSQENDDIWVFNVNGSWKPKAFEDKLTLAFDSVLGLVDDNYRAQYTDVNGKVVVPKGDNTASWWGLDLFAKYQFSKMFSLAGRAGYFHDDDGTAKLADDAVGATTYNAVPFQTTSTDLWSYTLTAGFDIWENLVTRVEYRLDVLSSAGDYDAEENAFANGQSTQHTVGVNVAYQF